MIQLGSPQECLPTPPWANQNFQYDMASGGYPGIAQEVVMASMTNVEPRAYDYAWGGQVARLNTPMNAPVIADSGVPRDVTMTMPQFTNAANDVAPNPQPSLTPADLLHPLPTIVTTQPVIMPQAPCSGVGDWINDNPVMAVGVLGVLAYFVWGKGRG